MSHTSQSSSQTRVYAIGHTDEMRDTYTSGYRLKTLRAIVRQSADGLSVAVKGRRGATQLVYDGQHFMISQLRGPKHSTLVSQTLTFRYLGPERPPAEEEPDDSSLVDQHYKVIFQRHHQELKSLHQRMLEMLDEGQFDDAGVTFSKECTAADCARCGSESEERPLEITVEGLEWASWYVRESSQETCANGV
jgi:hypothetical protein